MRTPGSWIRDRKNSDLVPGWKKFGSGIRDKHPIYATLLFNGFSRYPTITMAEIADPNAVKIPV
jgi:hypothetical protein